MIKFEWETVIEKYDFNRDHKSLKTSRAKVKGGWLVLHIAMQVVNGKILKSDAMTFLPDHDHEWEIE